MHFWDILMHFFLIGDYGNTNEANTLIQQFAMSWQTPALSLLINNAGYVRMQYGFGQASDERIIKYYYYEG